MTSDSRLSKNERRAQAREQAKKLHEQRIRRERTTKTLTIGGIVLGAVAIVAIVMIVIVNSFRPPGPGPENMASDGIVIGQGFVAESTDALEPEQGPVSTEERDDILQIKVYLDYMCPFCGQFETANGETLSSLIEGGQATVEIHPISFLDTQSAGSRYSTRAANAAGCVAEYSPDNFYSWNQLMFANQPTEGTEGLSNSEIIGLAEDAGVDTEGAFSECVNTEQFRSWVERATDDAFNEPGPNSDGVQITATPTVYVNGEMYAGAGGDAAAFYAFVAGIQGTLTGGGATPATTEPAEPEPSTTETPAPSEG